MAQEIRAHCHHTISLGLFASRAADHTLIDRSVRWWTERYPPEPAVISVEATVTMGPRSGSYLVSLRDGSDLQAVRSEHPEKVVELILATRPEPA